MEKKIDLEAEKRGSVAKGDGGRAGGGTGMVKDKIEKVESKKSTKGSNVQSCYCKLEIYKI
jgi:hypothetical protein